MATLVLPFLALGSASTAYAEDACAAQRALVTGRWASPGKYYNLACCEALAGERDAALRNLDLAVAHGWHKTAHMQADPDLLSLHDAPAWASLVGRTAEAEATHAADNGELTAMVEADQADRDDAVWKSHLDEVIARDAARLRRTYELLAAGAVKSGQDHENAALMLQHGHEPADYLRASELARRAAALDQSISPWLACAAEDRFLQKVGKPQIWGTQYQRTSATGPWSLEPLDRTAKTDAERLANGVPTLAEQEARMATMNAALVSP